MSQQALSYTRQPRLIVYINGERLDAALEAEVTNTSQFRPDTFHVNVAIAKLPANKSLAWWSSNAEILTEILIEIDGRAESLVYGLIDDVQVELPEGMISLSGRDLTARFIDHKSSEHYVNQTSSAIAQKLADKRGLKTYIIAANGSKVSTIKKTTTKAGKFYRYDHVVVTQEQTEWDMLIYLASHEGFDVWVHGEVLYFQPSPQQTSSPYQLIYQNSSPSSAANFVKIRLHRALTLARDVIVTVRSWHQAKATTFSETARSPKAKSQKNGGTAQIYAFTIPNLTKDQAQQRAQKILADITRSERVIDVDMPADNSVSIRRMVQLSGTDSDWDQLYYPDSIERSISLHSGYTMRMRAKNHTTQSDAIL